MAQVVNDRDVLIMAATPRFTAPADRGLFVTPSSAIFKVSGTSAFPASISFQATGLNIPGTVAWEWDHTALTVVVDPTDGNRVTVNYADMSAVAASIKATITVDGQTFVQVAQVTKVADGSNGTGTKGQRGNVDIAAATNSGAWSDAEAVAALSATGYGAPMNRDLVKLYKSDRTWSVQKMFNGTAWVSVDYVYDGSLFVKGSILPESLDTRGLTVRDAQGNIILGAGTALSQGYAAPGTLNSGLSLSSNGTLLGGGGGQVQTLPVIDGARTVNYVPWDYGVVHVKEFKQCTSIGIPSPGATYCTLETIKPWIDNSGGFATQWAFVSASEVWKRSGGCGDGSWGPWVRDLDRALFTGDLNSTYGATIGGNLGGYFHPGNISTYMAAATIALAHINTATIGNLRALSASIGYFESAPANYNRIIIQDGLLAGYRANNNPFFRIEV